MIANAYHVQHLLEITYEIRNGEKSTKIVRLLCMKLNGFTLKAITSHFFPFSAFVFFFVAREFVTVSFRLFVRVDHSVYLKSTSTYCKAFTFVHVPVVFIFFFHFCSSCECLYFFPSKRKTHEKKAKTVDRLV